MKSNERHRVLRKQRYNVARELGATWERAQAACQGGERFLAFLTEIGVEHGPYMHLYTRPHRVIGPRRRDEDQRTIRYGVLRQRGYSSVDALELSGNAESFEQAMEVTDP